MPGRPGRRLVPLRNKGSSDVRIRLLEARVGGGGGSIIWAGCNKPTPPVQMIVTNPGTSFARVVKATPTYKVSGVIFSFPCPPKPWDVPKQQLTGRPAPLHTSSQFVSKVVGWVKPGYQMNKKNAMSNDK